MTITELAHQYREIESRHAEAKKTLDGITKEWTDCETAITELMIEEGTNSISISGVGLISLIKKSYLSVTKEHMPLFLSYLKDTGHGALIKETIEANTLKAYLDAEQSRLMMQAEANGLDQMDANEKALAYLSQKGVSTFQKRSLSFRKAK